MHLCITIYKCKKVFDFWLKMLRILCTVHEVILRVETIPKISLTFFLCNNINTKSYIILNRVGTDIVVITMLLYISREFWLIYKDYNRKNTLMKQEYVSLYIIRTNIMHLITIIIIIINAFGVVSAWKLVLTTAIGILLWADFRKLVLPIKFWNIRSLSEVMFNKTYQSH